MKWLIFHLMCHFIICGGTSPSDQPSTSWKGSQLSSEVLAGETSVIINPTTTHHSPLSSLNNVASEEESNVYMTESVNLATGSVDSSSTWDISPSASDNLNITPMLHSSSMSSSYVTVGPSAVSDNFSVLNSTSLISSDSAFSSSFASISHVSSHSLSTTMSITTTPDLSTSMPMTSSSEHHSTIRPSSTTTQSHPTPSTAPTTQPPRHFVRISETNILLVKDIGSIFVKLTGSANEALDGLFLTIRNAKDKTGPPLQTLPLTGSLNAQGFLIVDKLKFPSIDFHSVVIALYSDKSQAGKVTNGSLLDSLLYSVDPDSVDPEIAETYQPGMGNNVYVNSSLLDISSDISLSLCNGSLMHSGFVLTKVSKNKQNLCDLNVQHSFQLKLTQRVGKKICPSLHLPNNFKTSLYKEIVTRVNNHSQCGFTAINIEDSRDQSRCVDEDKVVAFKFIVRSAFDKQAECIRKGYKSFIAGKSSIHLDGDLYLVSNCSLQCFPSVLPASSQGGDGKIKVTVAVVISCIGVFLLILMAVIIYMKRKRRGLLQFRMTRLDEDDDGLVGDMDDFVGNQGATFSNFR